MRTQLQSPLTSRPALAASTPGGNFRQRRRWLQSLSLGWLAAISVLLPASGLQAAPLQAVELVSADYPPYFGPSLQQGGVLTQIVVQAFRRSHYPVNIHYLPWARALADVREGKFDGMIALPAREDDKDLIFSIPLAHLQMGFYKQQERQISFKDLHELKSFKIGTIRGQALPMPLNGLQLSTFDSLDDTTNLRKLGIGRLDLVLTDRLVGKYLLENRLTDMRIPLDWQGQLVATPSQHLALSRKRAEAMKKMQAFNQGLTQMEQDGSLKKILQNAGMQ